MILHMWVVRELDRGCVQSLDESRRAATSVAGESEAEHFC